MHTKSHLKFYAGRKALLILLTALPVYYTGAQTVVPSPAKKEDVLEMEALSVTGSNIKRLDQEKVLPVTIFSSEQIKARDSATPMDLLIGIPEVTNIPANETSTNAVAARGGNANAALRGLGAENTLVLLNGRRMPFYPFNTSSVNVNTLPTSNVAQVEILRDGASAIYGSDAVAGVINTVTESKPNGANLSVRYGVTEHGGGMDIKGDATYGTTFANGKGAFITGVSAYYRDKIFLRERASSKNTNRSADARAPFNLAGGSYDGSTSVGIYPSFYTGTSTISSTATGYFYPSSGKFGDTPGLTATAIPRSLYANYNDYVVGQPQADRYSVYNRAEYELTKSIKVFGEMAGYLAHSVTGRQPTTLNVSDSRVQMSVDNPYNPFGSRFYSTTGAANADGTARLTGTPVPTTIVAVLMTDQGPEQIRSNESMYRLIGGFSGTLGSSSWTWETAAMLGGVRATDFVVNGVRDSYLRAAAQRTDATAYNPFGYTFKVANGAVVADQPYVNSKKTRDGYTMSANRYGHSKIASYDARIGGEVINTWAGAIAASVGVEWRYEFKEDHKDPFVSINPSNVAGGEGTILSTADNDILVMSPKVNFHASRTIASAFAETVIPLVGPKNEIPGIYNLEINGSGRYERYSDFGNTTKPKFGANWKPTTWLMVRGSYNKGFRAPDLADLYQPASFSVGSPPGTRDTVRNAYLSTLAGLPADQQVLTKGYSLANTGLQPEESTGKSIGIAVDVPKIKGLSFTVDYWEILQKNLIGSAGTTSGLDQALLLAYTQSELAKGKNILDIDVGSHESPSSPNTYVGDPFLLRAAVTQADKDLFNQTYSKVAQNQWIAPLGSLIGSISQSVNNTGNNYTNGLDYGISYNLPRTPIGLFRVSTEWAQFLNKFTKSKPGYGKNDVLMQMTTPRYKSSATVSWRNGGWDASVNATYSTAIRTGASTTLALYQSLGMPDYIKPVTNIATTTGVATVNYYERGVDQLQLNAGLSYRFSSNYSNRWLRKTSFRLGINNLLDEEPSLTTSSTGYSGSTGSSLFVGRAYTFAISRDL